MRKPNRAAWIAGFAGLAAVALAVVLAFALARIIGPRRSAGPIPPDTRGPAAARSPGAETEPPPEGAWLLAGPFSTEGLPSLADRLDHDYLAETGLVPSGEASAAPLRVGGDETKLWREAKAARPEGINFLEEFGPVTYSIVYAYREIDSPSAREALLLLGSDDGVKVWLNGSQVLAHHIDRALLADEDSAVVSLAKGRNRILVKVGQAEGEWGFSMRLTALDARAPSTAQPVSILALPDSLAAPPASAIGGSLMITPSESAMKYYAGPSPGLATVELIDGSGRILGSARASLGRRFSIMIPAEAFGALRVRARGEGSLAAIPGKEASLFVGDPTEISRQAVADARAAAATAGPEDASTLEFLALCLEGKLPARLGGLDAAVLALSEIQAMTGADHGSSSFPEGLWRYAFRSSEDNNIEPYSLYLPKGYRKDGSYGLLVFLHGASGRDDTTAAPLAEAAPPDTIVLCPFGRGDLSYTGPGERDVLEAMDLVMARYAIDPSRVYISGRSMGGYGAWRLAKLYPWRFAAVVTFAGWTGLDMLENLASTPLLAVHGDADDVIPWDSDQAAVKFLGSIGGKARFELLPGVGHDAFTAWTAREGAGKLFAWLRAFKRDEWPKTVKARTTMPRAGKVAWVSILGISRAAGSVDTTTAAVDASVVDARHVTVDTENVGAFELDLRHPGLAAGGRILVLVDGINLTADSGKPVRFELGANGRFRAATPESKAGTRAPVPNGGSGIEALFESRLQIVYGTKRKSAAAENQRVAHAFADELARFSVGPVPMLSDAEAEAAEEKGSAQTGYARLLIGNPDENSILARIMPKLPVEWKAGKFAAMGAAGPGLLLVYPDPERPDRLVGVFAPPTRGGSAAVDLARGIVSPMSAGSGDTCGYGTPDLAVFGASGLVAWQGFFDWRWKGLTGASASRK